MVAIGNAGGAGGGMITAGQSSSSSGSTTIGYAIPTNNALAIVNQIRAGQASSQVILGQVGYLGISATNLTPAIAAQLGLNVTSGALVVGIRCGSPAEQSGLVQDSVITDVAGNPISGSGALNHQLQAVADPPEDRAAAPIAQTACGAVSTEVSRSHNASDITAAASWEPSEQSARS